MNVLLGVSGSVACTLTPKLKVELALKGHTIKTVVTNSALRFKRTHDAWGDYFTDEDEWSYYEKENKVLHIDLVNWSDVLVIAPCTANTLSKIHAGICDNLLTCCVRAWPQYSKRGIILAPAMNSEMLMKDQANEQYDKLVRRGNYEWVEPIEKKLFCGAEGIGAMANIEDIIKAI